MTSDNIPFIRCGSPKFGVIPTKEWDEIVKNAKELPEEYISGIKRVDGFGCDSSCYNYKEEGGYTYCRATKQLVGIERGTDCVAFWYRLIQTNDIPSWCPLER